MMVFSQDVVLMVFSQLVLHDLSSFLLVVLIFSP